MVIDLDGVAENALATVATPSGPTTHRRGCPALQGQRSEKKRVAVMLGRPMPTFECTCPEAHWHEVPEFVRARARDKRIDLGGDGHRHRLVTARGADGSPS